MVRHGLSLVLILPALGCGDLFFDLERADGERCIADSQCASEICSEGVCCNMECGQPICTSCLGEANGIADGQCLPVLVGLDPLDVCFLGCKAPGLCQDCGDVPELTPCETGWCFEEACRPEICTQVSCNIGTPGFVLADTNQRVCYDTAVELDCASCGSLCGQDAQDGWDTEFASVDRFTRSAGEEPVVQDNASGLEWRGCVVGQRGAACEAGSAGSSPWSDAHPTCLDDSWAGGGWRLPDLYELQSLTDLSGSIPPAVAESAFPTFPTTALWSASVALGGAWSVEFSDGRLAERSTDSAAAILCVRGGRSPLEQRFSAGDVLVSDARTGLDWERVVSMEARSWGDSLAYCSGLALESASDWRVPSRAELMTLLNVRRRTGLIDEDVFPDTPAAAFWTSTSNAQSPERAWGVDFGSGGSDSLVKSDTLPVRCVRTR
ncbi:MAG: DUF1566 domain-containing protein [Myxococcota bacterium]